MSRPDDAPDVLGACDRLQMIWVATCPIAAQMVDLETFGDRANLQLVHDAVCVLHPLVHPDPPISVRMDEACPVPASAGGALDTFEKSVLDGALS